MTAPPDWYPDPSGSGALRYWDGQQWTAHLAAAPRQTATTPDGVRLAGWWHRVGAALLDNVIVGIASLPFTIAAQISMQDRMQGLADELQRRVDENDPGALSWYLHQLADLWQQHAWIYAAPAALVFLVTAVCLRVWGGTPGKLITGLRVRLRERPGNLGWGRAAARALLYPALNSVVIFLGFASGSLVVLGIAFAVVIVWGLLDPLWATWDPRKQTLHDKVVGTNVVRIR